MTLPNSGIAHDACWKSERKEGGLIPLTKYKILKLSGEECVFITSFIGNGKKYIYVPKVIGAILGNERVKVSLTSLPETLSQKA